MRRAFLLGDWLIQPDSNSIVNGELQRQMEPRAMDVLTALAARGGAVMSTAELLKACWGSTLHGDNPVHKTIAQLRRLLGDSAIAPRYIATIRKRGYQIVAPVLAVAEAPPLRGTAGDWSGDSPFRGLSAFDEEHAAIFFGRGDATARLVQAVTQRVSQDLALQLVLGPSGSGKTSLVCAGLLPAMLRQADPALPRLLSAVRFDLREAGPTPLLTALGGALLDWQLDQAFAFPGASAAALGLRLGSNPEAVAAELHATLHKLHNGAQPARLALFIDSFEAIFTLPDLTPAERSQLMQVLEALARSKAVIVILACRNDFYPRIADYPLLITGKETGSRFDLAPPTRAEMAQIIRRPTLAAGLNFEQDGVTLERLDQVLCDSAAGNPDALPLLQYALQELHRMRDADGMLSFAAFRQLGGIEGAIGQRAEQVIQALSELQRAGLAHVLSLVATLSSSGEQITSRRAAWSDLQHDSERELVQALVEARLFVSELANHQPSFGVAHEAVLRRWPRVLDWIDEHRHALRIRAQLSQQAARWDSEGRPTDLLIPQGKQLDEARGLLAVNAFSLSDTEQALIRSSTQRAARRARLRLGALTLMLALAALAAVAGLIANRANNLAQQRRAEAEGLMSFMLGDFADKLRPLGRLDLLDAVTSKAMNYLSDTSADDASLASLLQRAQALQVLAEVRIARGDSQAAQAALLAASAILHQQLARAPDDHQLWKNLGANAFWLGKIEMEQGHWERAGEFFQKYRVYSEQLFAAEPDNVAAWTELSYAHNNLGTLALKRGDAQMAAQQFARSVDLKTRALQRQPADRTLAAELADSLSWVGLTQETLGQLQEAQLLYERELRIVQTLLEASAGEALWQNRLAIALQHLGGIKLARGDSAGALEDWQRAEALLDQVLRGDPGNRVWQRNRAHIQLEQQRILIQHEDPRHVLARLQKIGAKVAELARLEPQKAEWSRLHAVALQRTASALIRLQRGGEAQQALQSSRQLLVQLLARNGADLRSRDALVQTWLTFSELHRSGGDSAQAQSACREAQALLPPMSPKISDFRLLDPWSRATHCIDKSANIQIATLRLAQMGYSELSYRQFLFNHK